MSTNCFECDAPAEHYHHVVPRSLGGTRTIPLCIACHSKVHGRPLTSSRLIKAGRARAKAEGKIWGGHRVKSIDKAEFIKRTKEGQQRAALEGRFTGNPGVPHPFKGKMMVAPEQIAHIKALQSNGLSLLKISKETGLSRPTVTKVLYADN